MRALFVLAALAVGLASSACSTTSEPASPPGPDPQASAIAAQKLCYVFQYVGESCRASADLVEVGDKTLQVHGVVTHQVDLPGGAARNVAYEVVLGGQRVSAPVEILGKGTSPEDAMDRAAQEWAAMAGTAVVDATRDTGRSEAVIAALKAGKRAPADAVASASLRLGEFHIYPGIPDIRGAMTGGPQMDHEGLLGLLESEIGALDASQPHTLAFTLQNAGTASCDKAEVDGVRNDGICKIIAAWTWPSPVSPYQVRQVYLIRPGEGPVPASEGASPGAEQ